MGRVLTSQQITDGQTYNFGYSYNLSGALVEETYPSGRKVKNSFQADGALGKVETQPSGGSYATRADNFTYTAAGMISSMQLGNAKWENANFNSRLQPTQLGLGTSSSDQSLWKVNYDYGTTDNNGNVKSQTITVPTITAIVQNYTYDSLNRIKSAEETVSSSSIWKQTFQYDRFGNRNFDAGNTTTLGSCPTAQCNPTIDTANNRFTSGQGYTYDSSGNLLTDAEGRTFTYDAENKQQTVANSGGTIGTYYYDGDGKRVKKVASTETTLFVYDASAKLVAEYLLTEDTPSAPTTSYLTNDTLGSPRVITDASGNIESRRDFMPFGEEISAIGGRTSGLGYQVDATRQKFTSYERDSETDLDFAQARMYSNKLGRFTNPDEYSGGALEVYILGSGDTEKQALPYAEITNPQTLNKYQYCLNNPLRFIDPSGHSPQEGWYESLMKFISRLWKSTTGKEEISFDGEDPRARRKRTSVGPFPSAETLVKNSWLTFGQGLDTYSRILETADVTGITGDARKLLEGDYSGLAVSGVLRAGGPALSKLFGTSIKNLLSGRLLQGINEGTTVAAQFTKSGDNLVADIVYVGGAKTQGISTTIGALYKNILSLAKQQGADKVTFNAVAVINDKLAEKLEKSGFQRTKVWIEGFGEVDSYTKTVYIKK